VSKKKRDSRADAIAALEARLEELRIRREHAKFMNDLDKLESLDKKKARAEGQLARLRRKERQESQ